MSICKKNIKIRFFCIQICKTHSEMFSKRLTCMAYSIVQIMQRDFIWKNFFLKIFSWSRLGLISVWACVLSTHLYNFLSVLNPSEFYKSVHRIKSFCIIWTLLCAMHVAPFKNISLSQTGIDFCLMVCVWASLGRANIFLKSHCIVFLCLSLYLACRKNNK